MTPEYRAFMLSNMAVLYQQARRELKDLHPGTEPEPGDVLNRVVAIVDSLYEYVSSTHRERVFLGKKILDSCPHLTLWK